MKRAEFLDQENWYGSYYELCMVYWPQGDDSRLLAAIRALWTNPWLEGPWSERAHFSGSLEMPDKLEPLSTHLRYGVLRLSHHRSVGCLMTTVRETMFEEPQSDWLDLSIPTGMLGLVFPVEYPLFDGNNPWLDEVDEALLGIADTVYAVAPFNLAIIGEEVSGRMSAQEIESGDLAKGGYLVPPALLERLKPDVEHLVLPTGLCWFPYRDR